MGTGIKANLANNYLNSQWKVSAWEEAPLSLFSDPPVFYNKKSRIKQKMFYLECLTKKTAMLAALWVSRALS